MLRVSATNIAVDVFVVQSGGLERSVSVMTDETAWMAGYPVVDRKLGGHLQRTGKRPDPSRCSGWLVEGDESLLRRT